MTKNGDFGASHDFAKKFRDRKVKIEPPKANEDMKVSKTLYIKMKYITYLMKEKIGGDHEGEGFSLNEGVNALLQMGVAYNEAEKLKNQTKLKDFLEVK